MSPTRLTRQAEIALVTVILLAAAGLRLIALDQVPPGLHHDEVIIARVAQDILQGRMAIYFPEGYGHEPLYHYILAGMFAAGGANEFTLRLTTALLGLLAVALAYRMARALLGRGVALAAMAWMAVSVWPVFYSRIGLRNITLPLALALAAWLLWRAVRSLSPSRWARYAVAGAALGLCFYTYQASRVFPFVFLVWAAYLALVDRARFRTHWQGLALAALAATLVAAPLAYYLLVANPAAEQRITNLAGPLGELMAGRPGPVAQLALATAGMFTVRGDGVWLYNVAGRPVFPDPISGLLFYAGLGLALWRWRKPAYGLLLLWLPISLGPAAVSWPAPNFVRTLGALPVVFLFPALAAVQAGQLVHDRLPRYGRLVLQAAMAGLVVWNAGLTVRDYGIAWPRESQVRWLYQATWTQAADWIEREQSSTPVAASGLRIHDFDPQTFDLLLRRRDVPVKWFDCRTSVLLPPVGGQMRYLSPDFFPCDANLWERFLSQARVTSQPRWPDSGAAIYTGTLLLQAPPAWEIRGQADFGPLRLEGWQLPESPAQAGSTIEALTFWTVTGRVPAPTKIFLHLAGEDGVPRAQWDGFDFGEAQLGPGDRLVERHRITLAPNVKPGIYHLSAGVYNSATMKRLRLPGEEDHLDLGQVQVR